MLAAFDSDLATFLGTYGVVLFYFVVWGLVFSGTGLLVGAFIPFITGDTLLFSAGLIAARTDSINILLLTLGVGFAAFAGDQVGYHLGQIFGRGYLEKHSGPFTSKAIARSENFYRMYGWWAVVVARFVPWGRVFIPVILGAFAISYIPERLRGFSEYRVLAFGAALVLMMNVRPEGLLPRRVRGRAVDNA